MNEIQKIAYNSLFELVKKVISISKEYDDNDYFNYGEENPYAKIQWIVDKLMK